MTFDHGKLLGSLTSDFGASGVPLMPVSDPAHVSEPGSQPTAPDDPDLQKVTQCYGDYNRIPYGWRLSPFMGKCGFKLQLKDFFSGSSPCYPIQDISCLGASEKKAWSHICATEFPCKAPVIPTLPSAYKAPPGLFPKPIVSAWDIFYRAIYDNLFLITGAGLGACFFIASSKADDETSDSITSSSDGEPRLGQIN